MNEDDHYREILAQRELVSRHCAKRFQLAADEDTATLAAFGYDFASHPSYPNCTPDEIEARIRAKDTERKTIEEAIANARAMSAAWLRVRVADLAALQAVGGEQLYELGEVPPTERKPRVGDRRRALGLRDEDDEREPIELDVETVEAAAVKHGLLIVPLQHPKVKGGNE